MSGDPASFSPMASSFIAQRQLPTSKDWSPFIKYGTLVDEDLAFLNSPTPRAPQHPLHQSSAQGRPEAQGMGPPGAPPGSGFWTGSAAGASAISQDDLMAIQSARLLSNKMALQDRLRINSASDEAASARRMSSEQPPELPNILNKKPRKTKPKARTGLLLGAPDGESALGFAAITNAARDLSPQRPTLTMSSQRKAVHEEAVTVRPVALPPSNDKTIRLNDISFVSTTAGAKEVVVVGALRESVG